MTTASVNTWSQSDTHDGGVQAAATCITTAAILETRGGTSLMMAAGDRLRPTGSSTTSQRPPGNGETNISMLVKSTLNTNPPLHYSFITMFVLFVGGEESSESETDNNEDNITTVKFLLLVDQLSIDQHHHLSIKDIGKYSIYTHLI